MNVQRKRSAYIVLLAVIGMAFPVAAQSYHDSVVIILDGSGSMSGRFGPDKLIKMEAARSALKKVLLQVPESTHVGLLVFNRDYARNQWAMPLGPRNTEAITKTLDSLRAGGGTPLGRYLKLGADRLLEERKAQYGYGTYRLLVVTDGEAGDRRLMERYTPDIVSKGIIVDVIGVDMKQNHTLAKQVHSYRRADDPDALAKALVDVFAEVGGDDSADSVQADFDLLEGISMEVAAAMLSALTTPSNVPIDERPRQAQTNANATSPGTVGSVPPNRPNSPSPPAQTDSGGRGLSMPVVVFAVIVVILAVTRKKRRKR